MKVDNSSALISDPLIHNLSHKNWKFTYIEQYALWVEWWSWGAKKVEMTLDSCCGEVVLHLFHTRMKWKSLLRALAHGNAWPMEFLLAHITPCGSLWCLNKESKLPLEAMFLVEISSLVQIVTEHVGQMSAPSKVGQILEPTAANLLCSFSHTRNYTGHWCILTSCTGD